MLRPRTISTPCSPDHALQRETTTRPPAGFFVCQKFSCHPAIETEIIALRVNRAQERACSINGSPGFLAVSHPRLDRGSNQLGQKQVGRDRQIRLGEREKKSKNSGSQWITDQVGNDVGGRGGARSCPSAIPDRVSRQSGNARHGTCAFDPTRIHMRTKSEYLVRAWLNRSRKKLQNLNGIR